MANQCFQGAQFQDLILIPFTIRYSIKELLAHEFFKEDTGVKVELAKAMSEISSEEQITVPLQLSLDDKKKRDKHKGDEAIQFEFEMGKDDPEEIAKEMVSDQLCHRPFLSVAFDSKLFFLHISAVLWGFLNFSEKFNKWGFFSKRHEELILLPIAH